MRKLALLIMLLAFVTANAQYTTVWERSGAGANLPTWFSTGNFERGFALNRANNHLYVASRNGGNFIKVLDANTGADLGDISTTGLTGGTLVLNDMSCSWDGTKIYVSNLAASASDVFKIYRYDNESAQPVVAYEFAGYGVSKRLGDNINLIGNASDNSMKIFVPDQTNNKIYILGTTDQGNTLVMQDSVVLPATTFGGAASVAPSVRDNQLFGYYANSSGKNATIYTPAGVLLGTYPGGVISTGTTTIRSFYMYGQEYIATFQFQTHSVRLAHVVGPIQNLRSFAVTPNLGTTANGNGTGDIEIATRPDGKIDLYVLATNNGLARYTVDAPVAVNGRLNENYTMIGTKLNSNLGFGANIDVKNIKYGYDSHYVYLGLESRLDRTNGNGIAIFIDVESQTGSPAGTALGAVPGGGHLFGDANNSNFRADFEVDYAFVLNPGGNDSIVYVDAAKYVGGKAGQYLGSTYNSGSVAMGPSADGIFPANTIMMAFDSAYGGARGIELGIKKSSIGASGSDRIKVFAVVVSSTAFFSDVTVPGNVTGGNPGFNVNFGTISGGPYNTGLHIVPVELTSFTAKADGKNVILNWATASELNNKGFEVQRSSDGINFTGIAFVDGKGTTSERNLYTYTDASVSAGKYTYRLKQVDLTGEFSFSQQVTVEVDNLNPSVFELRQNYPNPFNPSTSIKFTVASEGLAVLKVYNTIGQEVVTLFNAPAKPGQVYEAVFDASKLTSGVYIYTLQQGSNSLTRKMVLMK
ncbi:MAG: T9SS type A sorting domain-containing protein [Ignavibacteriaceae bacterium]|nr:T9SS type A sorting domain-containing protein [Ignavibacteriaceae bacterium]